MEENENAGNRYMTTKLERANVRKRAITKDERAEVSQALKEIQFNTMKDYQEHLEEYLQNKKTYIANEIEKYLANIPVDEHENAKGAVVKKAKNHMMIPIILQMLGRDLDRFGAEPTYSAVELGLVFSYYQEMITDINMKGIFFPPTRQNFCKFAGITTVTYNAYLNSDDMYKKTVAQKIEDYLVESIWTGAMTDKLNAYVVEKRSKLVGIGGGYSEAKSDININVKREQIGTPENMLDNLKNIIDIKPN